MDRNEEPSVWARVSVARRDLKKADDEISDWTYGSGYQASVAWVTRPGTGKPYGHSERG